jgi:hypothetical protein
MVKDANGVLMGTIRYRDLSADKKVHVLQGPVRVMIRKA